jgi:hypothetical protein
VYGDQYAPNPLKTHNYVAVGLPDVTHNAQQAEFADYIVKYVSSSGKIDAE